MNYLDQLREFHRQVFIKTGFWPADLNQKFIPGNETARLREYLHDEEVNEASRVLLGDDDDCSKAHLLKELCDVLYVVFGTAAVYNLPIAEAFMLVHENNMQKIMNGTVNLDTGKFIKPKDHPKVSFEGLIEEDIGKELIAINL